MPWVKYVIPKNRTINEMKIIPRKIVSVFAYLPNFRTKMEFIIGKIAAIPAIMNNSDLCPHRLGIILKSKRTRIISGSVG